MSAFGETWQQVKLPGPAGSDLRTYLTEERKIAIWKVPERIEIVAELPVTATGKIQKFALRDRYSTTEEK